jgi:hypothetical protein
MRRKLLGEPPLQHHSLVIQDVRTLHGSQFRKAQLIVGSSPCTKYSYMAMPWTRSKALAAWYRDPEHPERLVELNALYDAQFRIQREASEAAGRHIPMVVENVRGAIPWVGRSAWNFGSYHLWGDVPALMPTPAGKSAIKAPGLGNGWVHPSDPRHTPGLYFTRLAARSEEDGRKVPGFRFDGSGRSFQTASVEGMKTNGGIPHIRDGAPHTKHLTNPAEHVGEGRKHHGDWFRDPDCPTRQGGQVRRKNDAQRDHGAFDGSYEPDEGVKGAGYAWFKKGTSAWRRDPVSAAGSHNSPRRKAASAKIAKIPFTLAEWIGRAWFPVDGRV